MKVQKKKKTGGNMPPVKKSVKEWQDNYYPISADHPSLMEDTVDSLLAAVDHSITKWTGVVVIQKGKYDLEITDQAISGLWKLDDSSCALCCRVRYGHGVQCEKCPLYFVQGNSCGEVVEDAYNQFFNLKRTRKFVEKYGAEFLEMISRKAILDLEKKKMEIEGQITKLEVAEEIKADELMKLGRGIR